MNEKQELYLFMFPSAILLIICMLLLIPINLDESKTINKYSKNIIGIEKGILEDEVIYYDENGEINKVGFGTYSLKESIKYESLFVDNENKIIYVPYDNSK